VSNSNQFYIPYGEGEEHAKTLKNGLAALPSDFRAELCFMCEGIGEYEQTYTVGCGGGYYRSMGKCDYCGGIGLRQGDGFIAPAPLSVLEQVLVAGRKALTSNDEAGTVS
jgi:hypothetical protein